jgi:glycosyltransferase involved in cell wall biosynthesis
MKIALFSPLPPVKTGISEYTEEMLPALKEHFEIDIYIDPKSRSARSPLSREFEIRPYAPGSFQAQDYDGILYHMGNYYPAHRFVYEALKRHPGVVVLHDYVLQGFYAQRFEAEGRYAEYEGLLKKYYGPKGVEIARNVAGKLTIPIWETEEALDFPLNEEILDLAQAVIVHSNFVKDRVEKKTVKPIAKINHHLPALKKSDSAAARKKWGVGPEKILLSSAGFVNRNKKYDVIIPAVRELRDSRIRYILAGEDRGRILKNLIGRSSADIEIRGYLPLEEMESLIAASDICINLRHPTMGESSGSLLRQMGHGKPTIVTDCGYYGEFPDYAVIKIAPDIDEYALLKAFLAALAESPPFRQSVGREAAAYVERECDLAKCAREYANFIKSPA